MTRVRLNGLDRVPVMRRRSPAQPVPAVPAADHPWLGLQRAAGNHAVQQLVRGEGAIQRHAKTAAQIDQQVTGLPPLPGQKIEGYIERFRKKYPEYKKDKDYEHHAADIRAAVIATHYPNEAPRAAVQEVRGAPVTAPSVPGWDHPRHRAEWVSYLERTYTATGNIVKNKKYKVYELDDNYWGYVDQSHGEIEVIRADVKSGRTVGFKRLQITYVTVTNPETNDTRNEFEAIVEGALETGPANKLHDYELV